MWPRATSPPSGRVGGRGGSSSPVTTSAATSWSARIGRLTGRRLRSSVLPTSLAYAVCRVGDVVQRHLPLDLPLTTDGLTLLVRDCLVDASRTRSELGVEPRPLDETLSDTLAWMAGGRRRPRRHAGQPGRHA